MIYRPEAFKARVYRSGKSLVVTIPKSIVDVLSIKDGDLVDIQIRPLRFGSEGKRKNLDETSLFLAELSDLVMRKKNIRRVFETMLRDSYHRLLEVIDNALLGVYAFWGEIPRDIRLEWMENDLVPYLAVVLEEFIKLVADEYRVEFEDALLELDDCRAKIGEELEKYFVLRFLDDTYNKFEIIEADKGLADKLIRSHRAHRLYIFRKKECAERAAGILRGLYKLKNLPSLTKAVIALLLFFMPLAIG